MQPEGFELLGDWSAAGSAAGEKAAEPALVRYAGLATVGPDGPTGQATARTRSPSECCEIGSYNGKWEG